MNIEDDKIRLLGILYYDVPPSEIRERLEVMRLMDWKEKYVGDEGGSAFAIYNPEFSMRIGNYITVDSLVSDGGGRGRFLLEEIQKEFPGFSVNLSCPTEYRDSHSFYMARGFRIRAFNFERGT